MLVRFLKHCLTYPDGETWDEGRILAVSSVLTALGCTIYTVWKSGAFDLQGFGVGMGALFAGVGAHLKLRGEN